jgi:hypothetical protein
MAGRGAVDEVLQDVVQEAEHVLDEGRVVAPFLEGLGVDRGQAAHRGPLAPVVVHARGQGDLGAQVGLGHLQPQLALVGGQAPVHRVGEEQVGLARLQPDLQDLLPQAPCVHLAQHLARLGRRRPNSAPSRTASMNSSVMLMPWCRFSDLRLKSPEGFRISRNSSISGWWMSR